MRFQISIEDFNGPLDLMLYLIKEEKLDLFDLDLELLADQYISFVENAQNNQLEIASEYLSEMAGLIEYKSKKLLPRDKSDLEVDEYEEEQNLVQRLIEYRRYKEASLELADRYEKRSNHHSKGLDVDLFKGLKTELEAQAYYDQTPLDLIKAMEKVLHRYKLANPQDISFENKELSVDDVIDQIRLEFINISTVTLDDFLMESKTVHHLIVRFLAILDLLRMQEIVLFEHNDLIYLKGA